MKKILFLLFIVMFLLTSSGCWSSKELNDAAFLAGLAVEKEKNQIKATFQVLQPAKIKKDAPQAAVLISSTGPTGHEAVRRLIKGLKRRLYLSHTRVIIFDKEMLKKENIFSILDLAYRDEQFRLQSYLYAADDPAEILRMLSPLDSVSAIGLYEGTNSIKNDLSEMVTVTSNDFMTLSMSQTCCSYITVLKKHNEKKPAMSHVDIDGLIILKHGKMVKETPFIKGGPGILWFQNKVGDGSVSFPIDDKYQAAAELHEASTKIKPHVKDGKLKVDVYVKAVGDLTEWSSPETLDEKTLKTAEKKFGQKIKEEMEYSLKLMREEPITDVSNIGLEVYRQMPAYWHQIKDKWDEGEELFKKIDVSIHIDAKLKTIGLIKNNNHPSDQKEPLKSLIPWKEK